MHKNLYMADSTGAGSSAAQPSKQEQDGLTLRDHAAQLVLNTSELCSLIIGEVKKVAKSGSMKQEDGTSRDWANVPVICGRGDTIKVTFDRSLVSIIPKPGTRIAMLVDTFKGDGNAASCQLVNIIAVGV